jgi:protocatechuate 3,4-dioxygenase beta subunit
MSPLTRRGFLAGAAALTRARAFPQTPSCTLTAEQETGPYYIDAAALRQNITEGRPGLPLQLRVMLVDANRCTPIPNAALDVWHCDALGVYSGFANSADGRGRGGPGLGPGPGPGGPPPARQIDGTRFLRGVQLSDKRGLVEFGTLYPGWYAGRTIHIHLKVRVGGAIAGETYAGGHVSHTGQLFFPRTSPSRSRAWNPTPGESTYIARCRAKTASSGPNTAAHPR